MPKIPEVYVLSIYDKIKGPSVVSSTMEQHEKAKDVALRSFVAMGFSHENFDVAELILPIFSDEFVQTEIAFSLFFRILLPGEEEDAKEEDPSIACLSWIVPYETATSFYAKIPAIRERGAMIIEAIRTRFRRQGIIESELTKLIKNGIEVTEHARAPEIVVTKSKIPNVTAKDTEAGFMFLKSIPKKELTQLMQAAVLGEPILIIGDKYGFNVVTDALLRFNYQGFSRKIFMEDELTPPRANNAVGINVGQEISESVINDYYLSYSLEKKQIEYTKTSNQLEFANICTSQIFESSSIEKVVREYKTRLETEILPKVSQIINSLVTSQDSKQNIENTKNLILDIRKSVSKSEYNFIIELAIRGYPLLEDFLRKELFAEQFVMNGW
ncbi:MAG: hypothetical protein ACXAC6_08810 [Candidatus Hodarchaeales archaeon]